MQKEGAARLREGAFRAAEQQHAELEARVHVREQAFAVLEVEHGAKPPGLAQGTEEGRRALVGGNAAGRDQGHQPVGRGQGLRAFDEQAVQIDVAAAQQRVVAAAQLAGADHARLRFSRGGGLRIGLPQRRVLLLQGGDQGLAVGGARLRGDGEVALGEPFNLLQLDAVPRRIAQHDVEAAAPAGAEHGGKARPPVEKGFARGQLARLFHEEIGRLRRPILRKQLSF